MQGSRLTGYCCISPTAQHIETHSVVSSFLPRLSNLCKESHVEGRGKDGSFAISSREHLVRFSRRCGQIFWYCHDLASSSVDSLPSRCVHPNRIHIVYSVGVPNDHSYRIQGRRLRSSQPLIARSRRLDTK